MDILDCFTEDELAEFRKALTALEVAGIRYGAGHTKVFEAKKEHDEVCYLLAKMIKKARQHPLKEPA